MASIARFPSRGSAFDQLQLRDWDLGGEHPSVVVHDIASRPRPRGHVIVFANEKGGVGKSTLAFHTAMALCDAGKKVAVIDLDAGQATLAGALTNREATCRVLKIGLPCPRFVALAQPTGAYLSQEITRIGSDCDFVLLDAAAGDSPIGRRAIAMADTLVTPVNNSFADISLLGEFDAVTMRLKRLGRFTRLVNAIGEARNDRRMGKTDWIVMPNRIRRSGSNNETTIDRALERLSHKAGFRLGRGLGERVAYRELFLFGLTQLDLKRIPHLARVKSGIKNEMELLVADLGLPVRDDDQPELFPIPVSGTQPVVGVA